MISSDLSKPNNSLKSLKKTFKQDLVAGFSVSLIALPLCLGIAIASGFPPLAGLITAIVGGMLASRISGSFVTISGPAAGLIVISLAAAENLGGAGPQNAYAGYPYALAAIVVAGLIVALMGLLKFGRIGDVFPPAVVHGMLAAIGVIIMIKQIFPALGLESPGGSLIDALLYLPSAIAELNPLIAAIALFSLLILMVHPKISWPWVRRIPAPMWVLIFCIPTSLYFDLSSESTYTFLGQTYVLGGHFLVNMPAQLLGEGGLQFPDFSKIGSIAFWTAVVSIALVSGVESLLSAKAVDAIDPMQRESDLDQDMVSMGSGSTVAALIGGLPMISEIVRSSANIANGGKTQWANFFHGSFLLFFVLFASTVIELIPLSALAAMLVFTGFRLASPAEFKHMFEVGRQELYIFLVTLIGVVATDLIIGVLLGLVFKFLMMIFKGLPVKDLFRLKLRHEEHDGELEIHIDSKGLIFSNFLSLKSALDKAIKAHKNVKLDVSALLLIDHTCMQHLKLYDQKAKREGVGIQLSGLELFNSDSIHPLAQRYRDKYLTQKS